MRDNQSRDDQVDLHTLGLLTNKTIAAFLEPYDVAEWPELILLATLQGVLCFEKTFGYEKVAVADLRSAVEQRDCLLRARSPHGHQGNARKKYYVQEASPRTAVQGIYPEWWGDNITSTSDRGAASPLRKPVQDSLSPSSSEVDPDLLQRIAAAPPVCTTRKHTEREAKSRVREHLQHAQKLARQNAAQRIERVQKAVCRASSFTDQPYSNIDLEWPGSGSHDSILSNPWVTALVQQNGHDSD